LVTQNHMISAQGQGQDYWYNRLFTTVTSDYDSYLRAARYPPATGVLELTWENVNWCGNVSGAVRIANAEARL